MCCHNNILPSTITRLHHCNSSSSSSSSNSSSAYKPPPAEWLTTHNTFTTKQKPLPGCTSFESDAPPIAVGHTLGPRTVGGWRQQQVHAVEGSVSGSGSSTPGKKEGDWVLTSVRPDCAAIAIPHCLFSKLYPHQKQGIAWMWGLHEGTFLERFFHSRQLLRSSVRVCYRIAAAAAPAY
jgi:hypothetical protein